MQRTNLSGGSQLTSFATASSVVAGGGGGASGAWQNSSVEHLRRSGTTEEAAEEFGGDGEDDWGYEDEYGNWVSFNTGGRRGHGGFCSGAVTGR